VAGTRSSFDRLGKGPPLNNGHSCTFFKDLPHRSAFKGASIRGRPVNCRGTEGNQEVCSSLFSPESVGQSYHLFFDFNFFLPDGIKDGLYPTRRRLAKMRIEAASLRQSGVERMSCPLISGMLIR
jgi:hypothetical protein